VKVPIFPDLVDNFPDFITIFPDFMEIRQFDIVKSTSNFHMVCIRPWLLQGGPEKILLETIYSFVVNSNFARLKCLHAFRTIIEQQPCMIFL